MPAPLVCLIGAFALCRLAPSSEYVDVVVSRAQDVAECWPPKSSGAFASANSTLLSATHSLYQRLEDRGFSRAVGNGCTMGSTWMLDDLRIQCMPALIVQDPPGQIVVRDLKGQYISMAPTVGNAALREKDISTEGRFRAVMDHFKSARSGSDRRFGLSSHVILSSIFNVPDELFAFLPDLEPMLDFLMAATARGGIATDWITPDGLAILFLDGDSWSIPRLRRLIVRVWEHLPTLQIPADARWAQHLGAH